MVYMLDQVFSTAQSMTKRVMRDTHQEVIWEFRQGRSKA
jgi:hypothetical protein